VAVAGAVNIDSWIPKYIFGYLLYMTFMVVILSNVTMVNADVYDITPEQEAILSSPEPGIIEFLQKASVLGSISSGYAVLSILTLFLSLIFIMAVAKALKEVIPVLPS